MDLREVRVPTPRRVRSSGTTTPGAHKAVGRPTLHNIQGLRGVAALIVVMAHVSGDGGFEQRVFGSSWTTWATLPANTGVDLFFVISGVIMVVTTWRTFDQAGASRRFLLRRIGRIYPLYWLVNTAIIVLYLASPSSVNFDEGPRASILESYLLLPHVGRLPVLVAWSLVYEMYFYLVFALALMLGRSRFGWVMGAWVGVTLALSATVSDSSNPYVALVASPLSLEFVLGVVIGLAVVHGWFVRPRAFLAAGIGSYAACLVLLAATGWEAFPSSAVRVAIVAVPVGLLVYGAVGVEMARGRVVPLRVQRLGDASYSLYLTHVPALTLMAVILAGRLPSTTVVHALVVPAALVVVVCGALVCYRVLERPLQSSVRRLVARLS